MLYLKVVEIFIVPKHCKVCSNHFVDGHPTPENPLPDLAFKQCTLCIPPSAAKGAQILGKDVQETSNIANVRIYVKQAIGRMKHFQILSITQTILYLPIMDNIIRVCAAL